MAFTLRVEKKGLFGNSSFDAAKMVKNCGLCFGSYNDYYVLDEEEKRGETFVFYNPERIGRGIFFDGSNLQKGIAVIRYNIPTTPAEIQDFIRLAEEIVHCFGKASLYCEEEKRFYTIKQLKESYENMAAFSEKALYNFLMADYPSYLLTLARFPWDISLEDKAALLSCNSLSYLEAKIHELQSTDVYYAKPRLYLNTTDKKLFGIYTYTEECLSVFPTDPNDFLYVDKISEPERYRIEVPCIRFFIYSENKTLDGLYAYKDFVAYCKLNGAVPFDASHIKVPEYTKTEIMNMVKGFQQVG